MNRLRRLFLLCLSIAGAATAIASENLLPIYRVEVTLEGCRLPRNRELSLVLNGDERSPKQVWLQSKNVWVYEPSDELKLDPNKAFISVRFKGGRTRCFRRTKRWDPYPKDERLTVATFTVRNCETGLNDYALSTTPPLDMFYSRSVKSEPFGDDGSVACTEGRPLAAEKGGTLQAYWPTVEKVSLFLFDRTTYPGLPLAAFADARRIEPVGPDRIAFLWMAGRSRKSGAAPNSLDLDARVLDKRKFKSLNVDRNK
jgi:hypothetical protein